MRLVPRSFPERKRRAVRVARAQAVAGGALSGAIVGAASMFALWKFTSVNGYLYTACGIGTCFLVGYSVSLLLPADGNNLTGLTIYTLRDAGKREAPRRNSARGA